MLFLQLHRSIFITNCRKYWQFFSTIWHHLSDDECIFITLCLPYFLFSSSLFSLGSLQGEKASISTLSLMPLHCRSIQTLYLNPSPHICPVFYVTVCMRMHMGGGDTIIHLSNVSGYIYASHSTNTRELNGNHTFKHLIHCVNYP